MLGGLVIAHREGIGAVMQGNATQSLASHLFLALRIWKHSRLTMWNACRYFAIIIRAGGLAQDRFNGVFSYHVARL